MNYLIKIKNNSSKLIFYIYFLVNLSVLKAYSTENTYKIFFSENHMYLEKNNFLLSLPYKIKLEENLNHFEIVDGPEVCKSIFSISNQNLLFKDPKNNLKTYTECKLKLSNSTTKNSLIYHFGINRTFKSWCASKEQSGIGIKKTVEAVMNMIQAKDCKDDSIRESLFNARMLNLAGQELSDLSPLGCLVSLRALWLDNNELSNLKPLSSLKSLIVLSLSNNQISDIQVLSNFKELQWLFLSTNQIDNVDYLSNLEKIKVLSIKNNNIDNPKPLFQFNPNTLILANGNPFLKNVCKDYSDNKSGLKKISWVEKLCKSDSSKKAIKVNLSSPI